MRYILLLFLLANTVRAETLTITAYTLDPEETGGRRTTALMTKAKPGWTAAVSRNKMEKYLGKKIYIEELGVFKVQSLMKRGVRDGIDILVGNKIQAKKIGRSKRKVVIIR